MTPTSSTFPGHNFRFDQSGSGPLNPNHGSGDQSNNTLTGGRDNRLMYVGNYTEYHRQGTPNPDKPPQPSHNLPFLRNDEFVERLELAELQQKLDQLGKRVALAGIGGVGKSQLALEYCYRQRQEKEHTWVLWVQAGSSARYDEDMRSVAERLKIPGRDNAKSNINQLVSGWLGDARNGEWLLVVDNVDDIEILSDLPNDESSEPGKVVIAKSRLEYLPVCDHGSILFTTRRRTVAAKLVNDRDIIDIHPNEQHAVEMLRVKLPEASDDIVNTKLAAALEFIPLAIAQAIAYIRHSQPHCTPQEYLAMLEKGDDFKTRLLSEVAEEVRRDFREASNSIILSWQISFEHIREKRSSAADLLSLMSFYNYQGMPRFLLEDVKDTAATSNDIAENRIVSIIKELFHTHSKITKGLLNDHSKHTTHELSSLNEATLDGDIKVLRDYSFISSKSHKDTFEMHRLVQLAAQVWLKMRDNFSDWESESIYRLSMAFPTTDYQQWTERKRCHTLYLHARLALDWEPVDRETRLHLARFMQLAAGFTTVLGLYKQSEEMCRKSLKIRQELLGEDDADTVIISNMLTQALSEQGQYILAEQNCRQTLKGAKGKLSKKHPAVLESSTRLADILLFQGDYEAAETMSRKVLRSRRKVLGTEHPETLRSLSECAELLRKREKWHEAEEMSREALRLRTKVLQPDDPDLLESMHTLALILQESGKGDSEARRMQERTLAAYNQALGPDHPRTLASMHNLALQFQDEKQYDEASELLYRAWQGTQKSLGPEHPDSLMTMHCLAIAYYDQGRKVEGKQLLMDCIDLRKRVLREGHPDTWSSMRWLEDWERAEAEAAMASRDHLKRVPVFDLS